MKTYGLTTEYYMTNEDDNLDGIRVLRLQSAPPERTTLLGTDSNNRSNSADRLRHQVMCQEQNNLAKKKSGFDQSNRNGIAKGQVQSTKIARSSENELTTESNKIILDELVKQKRCKPLKKKRTSRPNSSYLENERRYLGHNEETKQKQHIKTKRPSFHTKKKAILSKTRPSESTLTAIIKSHENGEENYRLKQWIKQTEEMNLMHMNRNRTVSIDSSQSSVSEIDSNCAKRKEESGCMSLTTREATLIKVLDPDNRKSSAKSRTSESEEAHYNSQSYAHPPRTQLVLSEEKIVRIPDDNSICEINSIACLPDGRVLVSDFSNMQLKLLSTENRPILNLKLDEPPHDITVVSNSIAAAITGLAHDQVLIISVGQRLTIKRRFKSDCVCKAITSYESHIYLLCLYRYRTEIHVLSIDGVISIRFNLGNAVTSPKSISINALNGLIYIVDQNRGMYTVERCGKIVSRCFDKNIEQYIGVETDLNNSIFVSTKNPCGIYELDYDGKHLLPISFDYRAAVVKALAYNTASNSLVVGCANSEAIQVYRIHNSLSWNKR